MGTPHYHPCTGDCPNGLTAGAVARSDEPEPAAVRGEPYEPSDPADWTPGAGWERLQREMPHVIPAVISDEDMRKADEVIAQAEARPGLSLTVRPLTPGEVEAFTAAFKDALSKPLHVLPPSRPTRAEIRAAVFAELRANLDQINGTTASRPHYGGGHPVHRRSQVEDWLNRMEATE